MGRVRRGETKKFPRISGDNVTLGGTDASSREQDLQGLTLIACSRTESLPPPLPRHRQNGNDSMNPTSSPEETAVKGGAASPKRPEFQLACYAGTQAGSESRP